MTRDNTITCISISSKTSSYCRQPLIDQPKHPNDCFSKSDDGIYGPIENDNLNETYMTASARIAHTFRIPEGGLEMLETPAADCIGPCVETLCAICLSIVRTDDIHEASGGLPKKQSRKSGQFHDMLCSVLPSIVEHTTSDETAHEVLTQYHRIPHTIVLDSHRPDIAPHIVITPPDPWDVFPIAENNRVGYQTPWNLIVPPFFMSTSRMPTYQEWMSMFYPPPPPEFHATSPAPVSIPGSQCVFNRVSFQLFVDRTQNERLYHFTRELHFVNHRRLYKIAAIAASQRAQEFQIRYTDTDIFESLEKPFQWTDPADPILPAFGKCRDIHVIHSVNPFLVPHIVIQECGPNDPWTLWNNATDCQDLTFGHSLGVISSNRAPLTYMNVPDQDTDETIDIAWGDGDCLSSTDSSCPETPSRLDELGDAFFFEEDITECPSYLEYSESTSVVWEEVPPPRSKATFFILDEDEDDGPPEFDDWYISVARRTQEAEEAERKVDVMAGQYS